MTISCMTMIGQIQWEMMRLGVGGWGDESGSRAGVNERTGYFQWMRAIEKVGILKFTGRIRFIWRWWRGHVSPERLIDLKRSTRQDLPFERSFVCRCVIVLCFSSILSSSFHLHRLENLPWPTKHTLTEKTRFLLLPFSLSLFSEELCLLSLFV